MHCEGRKLISVHNIIQRCLAMPLPTTRWVQRRKGAPWAMRLCIQRAVLHHSTSILRLRLMEPRPPILCARDTARDCLGLSTAFLGPWAYTKS